MAPDTNTSVSQEPAEHPPLLLTDDQTRALCLHISRAFPPWCVWRAGVTWYATNPCQFQECPCSRTLHATDLIDLCRQLDGVEQAGRDQRGGGALTNEAAFLTGQGPFSAEAAELAERQLAQLQQDFPGWDITCVTDLGAPVWYARLRTPLTRKQKAAGVCATFMCFSADALAAVLAAQVELVHRARATHSFTSDSPRAVVRTPGAACGG